MKVLINGAIISAVPFAPPWQIRGTSLSFLICWLYAKNLPGDTCFIRDIDDQDVVRKVFADHPDILRPFTVQP